MSRLEMDPLLIIGADSAYARPQAEWSAEAGLMASSVLNHSPPPSRKVCYGGTWGRALASHYGQPVGVGVAGGWWKGPGPGGLGGGGGLTWAWDTCVQV